MESEEKDFGALIAVAIQSFDFDLFEEALTDTTIQRVEDDTIE